MLIVREVVSYFHPEATFDAVLVREAAMWLVAAAILVIVRLGEGLPFSSVGLTAAHLLKSFLWALLLAVACFVVAGVFVAVTRFNGGKNAEALAKLPVWLITAIVIRAGVAEELCYRGYAIERLHALGLPRGLAAAVPLLIVAIGHWTGGWLNILLALLLGAILAAFYLWRRDLAANMIGHTLVDFIPNVLPRLLR